MSPTHLNAGKVGSRSVVPTGSASEPNQQSHGRHKNFHHRYLAMCRAKNYNPIPEIVSHKRKNTNVFLDVYCDRFNRNDWQLITVALCEDRSLQRLALRLRKTYTESINETNQQRSTGGNGSNRPAILEKRLLKLLIGSLSHFLITNQKVETFTMEGFPLDVVSMSTLTAGLKRNSSLVEMNLARCSIGDEGCEMVCREIKYLPNLQTLNLSACLLTARGCQALADAIKFQKMQRYDKRWELSLRYGEIMEDKLFGVKRLYLSHNPSVGDGGLLELSEVLKDDAWITEVHMCNCGLTNAGTQMLLECLNLNATIEKFDIRENMSISNEACLEILTQLGEKNLIGDGSESLAMPAKNTPNTVAGFRERCELNEAQLHSERERNSQLESMVEQLHLKLGDYAMQISELQRQLASLVQERNELQSNVKKLHGRPVAAKGAAGALRKTQSEACTTPYYYDIDMFTASKSEVQVQASSVRGRRSPVRPRSFERFIGDCGRVATFPQTTKRVAADSTDSIVDNSAHSTTLDQLCEHIGDVKCSYKDEGRSEHVYDRRDLSISELLSNLANLESDEVEEKL